MNSPLDNYLALRDKVDILCESIQQQLGERITCSAGCGGCCQSITLFPVEADALRAGLAALTPEDAERVRAEVRQQSDGDRCPLLVDERCLLYPARPIICRTHGLPILYNTNGSRAVDCCPLNDLTGLTLTGSMLIDLERLNTLLATINAHYLKESGRTGQPERIPIAEAILTP